MSKHLVIVESPTKAKKISEFLGRGFDVQSSYGHVRDLPKSAMGIDIEGNFEPEYVVPTKSKEVVAELRKRAKSADMVFFATDEDREGEAISWHLNEVLKIKPDRRKRIVFHEITKAALERAMAAPRDIDINLVKAQEARRLLDRLYGYEVSPLLWRKIRPGLSAGRVQSVAIRLLVERERLRLKFKAAEYWDVAGQFTAGASEPFPAELVSLDDQPVATSKDFDPNTGELKNGAAVWLRQAEAEKLAGELRPRPAEVVRIEEKPFTERPYPPFTTSTLQQEANRKLRFPARRTMQLAQSLYENGFITYMRTDSTTLSDQAVNAARNWIEKQYGTEFLPAAPRQYQTKVKNAQEAHEAVRPAGETFTPLDEMKRLVDPDAYALYELIWKRTVASQMTDATGRRVAAAIKVGRGLFAARGKIVDVQGYRRAYVEGSDDPEAALADQETILPPMQAGDRLTVTALEPKQHITQPPQRLTEAALVKELEQRGIGRPSTYASIIDTILRREYVVRKGTALIPTFTAFAVVNMMERYLGALVDYAFTAKMEDQLDTIAAGQLDDRMYLKHFYFGDGNPGLKPTLEHVRDTIDPRLTSGVPIGERDGHPIEVRIGRYGPFIRWNEQTARIPDQLSPDDLTPEKAIELLESQAVNNDKVLGSDPATAKPVYLKIGRFGPYVQLGDRPAKPVGEDGQPLKGKKAVGEKPKMASLLKGMVPESVTLDTALQLLALPREVGLDPKSHQPIMAANGRFGPYIKCGTETRSIPDGQDPLTISLDQCLTLLAQEKKGRGRRTAAALRELGPAAGSTSPIKVMNGRYGPYVTDGTTNATIPDPLTPESITLEQAVDLIAARAARGPVKRRRRKK